MLKTFVELNKIVGKKINNDLHWQNKQNKIIKINNVIMQQTGTVLHPGIFQLLYFMGE
jgi:hypothetical protein